MSNATEYLEALHKKLDLSGDIAPGVCEAVPGGVIGSSGPALSSAQLTTEGGSAAESVEAPLFGNELHSVRLKKELVEHRQMVLLKVKGFSDAEIAGMLDYTPVAVRIILRQPHTRKMLLDLLHKEGAFGIDKLLKSAAEDCVLRLIDIVRDEKAKHNDAIAASEALLNRFLGKPTQRIESTNVNVSTSLQNISKTQKELAEVEAELKRLTGRVSSSEVEVTSRN